jgi:hypothetical protein
MHRNSNRSPGMWCAPELLSPYQYRQSLHKVIYSTGVEAMPKAADYREKEARDILVKELQEGRQQALKDTAAKYLQQFNADQ